MTDLERRALLGDKQAQEECTRQGIVLVCGCGGFAELSYVERDPDADFDPFHGYIVKCKKCVMNSWYHKKPWDAVAAWNNRAAPPFGRCKDCGNWRGKKSDADAPCKDCDGIMEADNFCRNFEPKEK